MTWTLARSDCKAPYRYQGSTAQQTEIFMHRQHLARANARNCGTRTLISIFGIVPSLQVNVGTNNSKCDS